MNRGIRLALLIITLIVLGNAANQAKAGGLAACFKTTDMDGCNRQVLEHVEFKSVVLQFVDPAETQLGEGLARLLWREILQSISNVAGAGVILAYDREGQIAESLGTQNVQEFLHNNYHAAAIKIAEVQAAQMAVWGAVLSDGEGVYMQNYLTLYDDKDQNWTKLEVRFPSDHTLSIPFMRKQINLPEIITTRHDLLNRRFYTRCGLSAGCPKGIPVRSAPSNDSAIPFHLGEGDSVKVTEMQERWWQIDNGNDQTAWINIYHLEMYPDEVRFDNKKSVNVRVEPNQAKVGSFNLDGTFTVFDVKKDRNYPWYFIEVEGKRGWVRADIPSNRSYVFPAVHLIAGLYRYNAGQYSTAREEFATFLSYVPEEDNVTRASVLKLLAASELAGTESNEFGMIRANKILEQALEYTPYDASVYSQQAMLHIVKSNTFREGLDLLNRAYELNPKDPAFLAIVSFIEKLDSQDQFDSVFPSDQRRYARRMLAKWD